MSCQCSHRIRNVFAIQHKSSGLWLGGIGSDCIKTLCKKDCSMAVKGDVPDLAVRNEVLLASVTQQQKKELCTVVGCDYVLQNPKLKCPVHTFERTCTQCNDSFWQPAAAPNQQYCSQACEPMCAVTGCEVQISSGTRCQEHYYRFVCRNLECSATAYRSMNQSAQSRCSNCLRCKVCVTCGRKWATKREYDQCWNCNHTECVKCGKWKAKIPYADCHACRNL